eukprot:comp18004_c0_seq1/m.18441 comp18004_c0_seq1/g.18441  ORF comp18004_c0_seq1/g.18441 comp18004_c0_seq1/m.18441 type:complete len:411 (-) comp18004_c0_seq1:10-1242(-)
MVRLNGQYDPWLGGTDSTLEQYETAAGQGVSRQQMQLLLNNPNIFLCPNNDIRVKQEYPTTVNVCTQYQGQSPLTPITPSMLQPPNSVAASPAPSVDLASWSGVMGAGDLGFGSLETPIFSEGALEEADAAILSLLKELEGNPNSLLSLPTSMAAPPALPSAPKIDVSQASSFASTGTPGSSRCVSPNPPFFGNCMQPFSTRPSEDKPSTLLCTTPPATPTISIAHNNGSGPQVKFEAGSRQEESDGPVSDMDQSNGSHRECSNCHTTETTMWRRHPINGYLCNPCGAYLRAHGSNRPIKPPEDPVATADALRCENCQTTTTIMWRQTPERGRLCNACGLFWRKHRKDRPLKLCKNMVCKRRRHRREVVVPPPGTLPRPISYAVPGHFYLNPYSQIPPISTRQIVFHNNR